MMNVLRGTQETRQLPHAGSGKRAGRPARKEGLSVGPNGRRETGRGGGRLPLFQRRTWGLKTGVREAGGYGASRSVPNTHWARTATAAELGYLLFLVYFPLTCSIFEIKFAGEKRRHSIKTDWVETRC